MKRYLILFFTSFFALFLFTGCASKSLNDGILRESEPIFIDTKAENNQIYLSFRNSSGVDSNLTKALGENLSKNGYEIVANENLASTIIKGNLNYFRKVAVRNNSYPNLGIGLGRGWSNVGVGIGVGGLLGASYIYDAQLSLFIEIKNAVKSYSTLLNYQSSDNARSLNSAIDEFNYKISNQILRYLNGY